MVAEEEVMFEEDTEEITGGVVSVGGGAWVVKVLLAEVVILPAASRDFTL